MDKASWVMYIGLLGINYYCCDSGFLQTFEALVESWVRCSWDHSKRKPWHHLKGCMNNILMFIYILLESMIGYRLKGGLNATFESVHVQLFKVEIVSFLTHELWCILSLWFTQSQLEYLGDPSVFILPCGNLGARLWERFSQVWVNFYMFI